MTVYSDDEAEQEPEPLIRIPPKGPYWRRQASRVAASPSLPSSGSLRGVRGAGISGNIERRVPPGPSCVRSVGS